MSFLPQQYQLGMLPFILLCYSGVEFYANSLLILVTWTNVIRPLSGTSSFSNDTVRFTRFFVYNGDHIIMNHYFLAN